MVWDKQRQAYFYALTAVILWATVASAFKITLQQVDYLELLIYSSGVSCASLFIVLLAQKKVHLLKTYTKKEYATSFLLGILNPFLYYLVLFRAYSLLPAQQAQPLNYTWPIMVVLLSIPILHQKITITQIIAILTSFLGVIIISTQGYIPALRMENITGIALALSSAIIWALFWIYNIKDPRDIVPKLFLNFTCGFFVILAVFTWSSSFRIPSIEGITGIMYVGIFEMGITFVLWLKALSLSKTTAQVSTLIYVSPFLSLAFIAVLVGEHIMLSTVIGLIFIVGGLILQHYFSQDT